jgi:hypothetical protein
VSTPVAGFFGRFPAIEAPPRCRRMYPPRYHIMASLETEQKPLTRRFSASPFRRTLGLSVPHSPKVQSCVGSIKLVLSLHFALSAVFRIRT